MSGIISCGYDSTNLEKCNKDGVLSPFLCDAEEALSYLTPSSNAIFIQISTAEDFVNEHIPTAVNLWRPDFRSKTISSVTGLTCSKVELGKLLSGIGVDSSSLLIVYDNNGSVDAFRFTWVLDLYGFKKYKVINGGLKLWKNKGFFISTGPSIPKKTSFYEVEGTENTEIIANLEDVKRGILDSNVLIVDTREPYEFRGEPFISKGEVLKYKKGAYRAGAIPTAIHLNWSDLVDLETDHRIKCEKDLRHDLLKKGITPDKSIIVYCQSGSRSSHTALVLRQILSYPNVRNYDGSWIEWSYESLSNNDVEVEQRMSVTDVERKMVQLEKKVKKKI